jgi:hypothetical protein
VALISLKPGQIRVSWTWEDKNYILPNMIECTYRRMTHEADGLIKAYRKLDE